MKGETMKKITQILLSLSVLMLAACGGGGGSSDSGSGSNNGGGTTSTTVNNQATVTVGPGLQNEINIPTTSVTICAPGTTNCQTINNVLIDTGSSGLRIAAGALNGTFLTSLGSVTSGNSSLAECMQFADSYSWGSIKTADIQIAGEKASSVLIQVPGDPSFTNVPSDCSATSTTSENTPQTLGVNGILGVGNFASDCGSYCAGTQQNTVYYNCPSTGNGACTGTTVPVANQVLNPVTLFATDNNGTILSINAPDATNGSASETGTLTFGVGTQSNNALSGTYYSVDSSTGFFNTTFNGTSQQGFTDSGSSVYFINDSQITQCAANGSFSGFYCPASQVALSATISGMNGNNGTINFNIGNAQSLVNAHQNYYAFSNLGVYSQASASLSQELDFGLPFFFGKNVATIIEGKSTSAGAGPGIAF
jgi:hypothetical protein